jgi:hypothetical protein
MPLGQRPEALRQAVVTVQRRHCDFAVAGQPRLDIDSLLANTAPILVVIIDRRVAGPMRGWVGGRCSVRCCVRVLLACLVAVVLAAPLRAENAAAPSEPKPLSLAANSEVLDRVTIAAIGDSLGDGLWEGLYRQLRGHKRFVVYRGAKRSVGFTTSDMTEQIDAAVAAGPVHAFVVMIGANDDRRSFFDNGRAQALFASTRWIELYRGRVGAFMDHAGAKGVPVIWVLLPVMRTAEATTAAQLVNGIIVEAAARRPHIALVATWSLTGDDKGAYMPYFNDLSGRKRLMRHADGLHFSEPGYELLAHLTFNRLQEASPLFTDAASAPAEAR